MGKVRYGVEINRLFNCFDAWVAVETRLLRREGHGRWREIDSEEFDTTASRRLGMARARRLARRWMAEYDAERLD